MKDSTVERICAAIILIVLSILISYTGIGLFSENKIDYCYLDYMDGNRLYGHKPYGPNVLISRTSSAQEAIDLAKSINCPLN